MRLGVFTLQVLMYRTDLLTLSDFFGLSVYIHFRHDWYPIPLFTFIPVIDRFTMHMVDPRVFNGRAIKIIYTLLIPTMDNSCPRCFAAQNLTEQIKTRNNGKFQLLFYL